MSESRYIDPSTTRKDKLVKQNLHYHRGIPLFSIVEYDIIAACNRSCSFCPVSDKDFYRDHGLKGRLSIADFEKVLLDLREIEYKGKVLFSGCSEPLLHKQIENMIALAKETLPEMRVEIISNGDLVTVEKLVGLFEAGLDTISISLYDGPHQLSHFELIRSTADLDGSQVMLRRRYYEDGNYGLTVSNRGGLVDSNQYRDEREQAIVELPLRKVCHYPFYMIKLDISGDMVMCSHDWSKRFVVGNVKDCSIWELWNKEELNQIKLSLSNKNRNMPPCDNCDVHGDIIGQESFVAWKEAHEEWIGSEKRSDSS